MAVRRIRIAVAALLAVLVIGTVGYVLLGFGVLDAVYQTVTTVTTVGFREVRPLSSTGKVFTIALILAGVGTALYTLTQVLEAIVDGHLLQHMEARRMDRSIARMHDHVIICGWGRVGRAGAAHLVSTGQQVVVVDRDAVATRGHRVPARARRHQRRRGAAHRPASTGPARWSPRSTPTPTTSTSRCRRARCGPTSSSSPGPGRRSRPRSCCAPAPTGSSTRS